MPHIVKYKERRQLVKNAKPSPWETWEYDLARKYVRPLQENMEDALRTYEQATSSDTYRPLRFMFGDTPVTISGPGHSRAESLFNMIEKVIEETLPQTMNEYFDKFVDVKEVPYGTRNSDTNN